MKASYNIQYNDIIDELVMKNLIDLIVLMDEEDETS